MIADDDLYQRLMAMRAPTIGRYRSRYPNVPEQQLEDLYSGVLEMAWAHTPPLQFEVGRQIQKWVNDRLHEAVSNYMRRGEYAAAHWADASELVEHHQARDDSPDQVAEIHEDHLTLYEYIAELSEGDRRIGLLYLHPESRLPAKQIAALENIPYDQAKATLKRLRANFSYYEARLVGPATICARRRKDLTAWQKTGQMPFALAWHIKRCPTCAVACNNARGEVVGALMPFMPVAGLPVATGGLIARLHHHIGSHRLVVKTTRAVSKVSRMTSTSGGGAAAAGGKVVVVAVVLSTTAAAGAAGVVHVITASHHHARTHALLAGSVARPSSAATTPAVTHFTHTTTSKAPAAKKTTRPHKATRRHRATAAHKNVLMTRAARRAPTPAVHTTAAATTPTTSSPPPTTTTVAAPTTTTATTPPAPNSDHAPVSPSVGASSSGSSSSSASSSSHSSGGSSSVVAPNGTSGTAP